MRSVWSVLGPFVAKEAPRDRGCSWSLASIQYPIDCGAAGCDRRRKKGGVRGLYAYCFQQSSTGTNKVAATTALRKSGYSWEGERQNYELKNPMPNPLFCSWKKHLNFPVFFFFFHMEWIFGIVMFHCHVCLKIVLTMLFWGQILKFLSMCFS